MPAVSALRSRAAVSRGTGPVEWVGRGAVLLFLLKESRPQTWTHCWGLALCTCACVAPWLERLQESGPRQL